MKVIIGMQINYCCVKADGEPLRSTFEAPQTNPDDALAYFHVWITKIAKAKKYRVSTVRPEYYEDECDAC